MGDLIEAKGFPVVLDVVRKLREEGLPVELEVVGRGPRAPHGGEAGITIRAGDAIDVRQAMARSHLLLLPSRGEGTPLVVSEAIAMNLPVAATAVGGIPDLFRARKGWHRLERGDEAEIMAVVRPLLADPTRVREGRAEMTGNPREDLYVETRAHRLAELLTEVLEERSPRV